MIQRNDIRIPFITSGKVATLLSADSGTVYTVNVSRQGLCFFSKTSFPLEGEIILELDFNRPDDPRATEHLHGRVLWKREWGELTAHGIHLSSPLSPEKTPHILQKTLGFHLPVPANKTGSPVATQSKGSLTEREREITRLIAQGHNNREMAQRLSISIKTVETHRANIYAKLKVHNAVQLLRALEKSGTWVLNQDQVQIQTP